jgi:Aspartyl/Asparaginyl beta-hydroxylase
MIDLSSAPLLDKSALVGGCARLPLRVDAERLAAEVAALPAGLWGSRGGRVGVHNRAEAIFLRGHAPAEGDKPIEDREPYALVPYLRSIIDGQIRARPLRCLLARMHGGGYIAPHIDLGEYFNKTVRLHIPVTTHERVAMYASGHVYRMRAGEVWALNNCAVHGVINASASESRTHVICDFLADAPLLELLARSERGLGVTDAAIEAELERLHQLQLQEQERRQAQPRSP